MRSLSMSATRSPTTSETRRPAALRHRRQVADLHVFDHAAAQRVHLGHRGDLLVQAA
jgi:hypothetical protein